MMCPLSGYSPDLSDFTFQWYRVSPDGLKTELISGARPVKLCRKFSLLWSFYLNNILMDVLSCV